MNKLMGFYELKQSGLPCIPWKEYTKEVTLDPDILWTIRTAIFKGKDINLPRCVGMHALKAAKFANDLKDKLKDNGIVVYYPFFVADKSGNLVVSQGDVVIEAVYKDLWNLTTDGRRDVTVRNGEITGKLDFLQIVNL